MTRAVCWTFALATDHDVTTTVDLEVRHANRVVTTTVTVYPVVEGRHLNRSMRGLQRAAVVDAVPMPRFLRKRFVTFADEALRAYERGSYTPVIERLLTSE